MKNNGRIIIFYIILIVGILIATSTLMSTELPDKLQYSEIVEMFKAEKVDSFIVKEDNTLIISAKDGSEVNFKLRSLDIFRDDLGELILEQKEKARGEKKAMAAIQKIMSELNYNGGKVIIDHCFNEKDANKLKELIIAAYPNADVRIEETRGLCSFYAEVGGLMVGFEG